MENTALRKRLFKLAAICFLLAVLVLAGTYFLFHYVTDGGITLIRQEEAGKPFITMLCGFLGAQLLFTSVFLTLYAWVVQK